MQLTPTQIRAAAWLSIAVLASLMLWALGPVLTPFVVAAVLAYALAPLVDRLVRATGGRLPRVLAVTVVEALFLLALAGLALLVVPILAKELPLMRAQAPVLLDRLDATLAPWLAQFGIQVSFDLASLKAQVLKYLNANFEEALASIFSSLRLGGSMALAVAGNALLIPVALSYVLLDWGQVVGRVLELVPRRLRPAVDRFTAEADQVLGQYLRGQLLVMLAMAVFFVGGLALFGLDLALPIGVFTGLGMFVPYLGFGLGLLLAALAGVLQFSSGKALVMVAVVFGLGQLLESLVLTPRLVGERIGLHPLAVIFALLAFGQLFGFVGVLVALPASAVLLVAIRRLRSGYMASPLYQST